MALQSISSVKYLCCIWLLACLLRWFIYLFIFHCCCEETVLGTTSSANSSKNKQTKNLWRPAEVTENHHTILTIPTPYTPMKTISPGGRTTRVDILCSLRPATRAPSKRASEGTLSHLFDPLWNNIRSMFIFLASNSDGTTHWGNSFTAAALIQGGAKRSFDWLLSLGGETMQIPSRSWTADTPVFWIWRRPMATSHRVLVPSPVCDINGQDHKAQLWWGVSGSGPSDLCLCSLQRTWPPVGTGRFAAKYESLNLRPWFSAKKQWIANFGWWVSSCPEHRVRLRVLLMSKRKMECEMDMRFCVASAVLQALCWIVMVKR